MNKKGLHECVKPGYNDIEKLKFKEHLVICDFTATINPGLRILLDPKSFVHG